MIQAKELQPCTSLRSATNNRCVYGMRPRLEISGRWYVEPGPRGPAPLVRVEAHGSGQLHAARLVQPRVLDPLDTLSGGVFGQSMRTSEGGLERFGGLRTHCTASASNVPAEAKPSDDLPEYNSSHSAEKSVHRDAVAPLPTNANRGTSRCAPAVPRARRPATFLMRATFDPVQRFL